MDAPPPTTSHDDPSFSLVHAVRAIARDAGNEIDFDDLLAAMGLSWMVCTVPDEPNVTDWSMYARDAFLIPAGRLFGLTIREIHPPQAARGLDHAAEFEQHFDASYRPLILRALEHRQPVLAWRGWPGERRLWWGVVTAPCDEGIGFRGAVYPSRDLSVASEPHVLVSPPTQLYVVETVAARRPVEGELEAFQSEQRRRVLSGEIDERFGIKVRISAANALFNARSPDMAQTPRKMLRLSSILVQLCDAGAAELAHQPSADRFSDTGKSDGAVPQGESLQPESARRR
ncbi:MAG: hypothetical protein Q7R41_13135, partial [Phycisphaerales bacterium]|nr:hypothetical protein [Phycisphaerales bacterium]